MEAWLAKVSQRCPRCTYDVAQTLRDGFRVCPECGTPISEDMCTRDLEYLSAETRGLIYLSWLGPGAALSLAMTDAGLWSLAGLVAAGVLGVYAGWWWIERWLQGPGAWRRAIVPAMAATVMSATFVAAFILVVAALGSAFGLW